MEKSRTKYGHLGLGLTFLWVLVVSIYLVCTKSNPFAMEPNEFGDFWAGVVGPLALLWIVLGFWQQGQELRNSVDALNLQSNELKNSVKQQEALVEITKKRAEAETEALKEERKSRRLANAPKIVLSAGGGSTERVIMTVRNIGASCSNLNISAVDGENIRSVFSESTLAMGESREFKFRLDGSEYLNFHFEIHYLNRLGEAGHQRINANRADVQTVGFNLVASTCGAEIARGKPATTFTP